MYVPDLGLVQGHQEVEVLQRLLQDKANEVKQLQKKVSDVEHEKHTELVKLRLEVRYIVTYAHTYKHVPFCTLHAHAHTHTHTHTINPSNMSFGTCGSSVCLSTSMTLCVAIDSTHTPLHDCSMTPKCYSFRRQMCSVECIPLAQGPLPTMISSGR